MLYSQTITYQFDVAPHLRRGLVFRARRIRRWNHLHRHEGRAACWRIMILGCLGFWAAVAYAIHSLL